MRRNTNSISMPDKDRCESHCAGGGSVQGTVMGTVLGTVQYRGEILRSENTEPL